MAKLNKQNRKSLSFLTPQSQRVRPSQSRMSLSSQEDGSQRLFATLLNDPMKRTLLMQVLSQDTRKDNSEKKKERLHIIPNKKANVLKCESPTALYRRRALQQMQEKNISLVSSNNEKYKTNVPFEQILEGVVAYVEIKSNGEDRSAGAKALMQAMGARIRDVLSRDITHVVFKDGCFKTYQKAKILKVHLVSVLWIDAVRRNQYRVPEKDYPALGATSSSANVSLLCQRFQKDYDDLLKDELNKLASANASYEEDIIDTTQDFDVQSACSVTNVLKQKSRIATPNSLYLRSTPDITSDSDSEIALLKKTCNKSKQDINIRKDIELKENVDLSAINVKQLSNSLQKSSDSEELSSLRISDGSSNRTPINKVLQYNNVTERKKRRKADKSINILENHVVTPNKILNDDINVDKNGQEITNNVYELNINSNFENLCIDNNLVEKNNTTDNKYHKRKSFRRLYNINDSYTVPGSSNIVVNNTLTTKYVASASSGDDFVENRIETKSKGLNNVHSQIKRTPKNRKISSIRECATTPRRKSTRLLKFNTNVESPPKRTRSSLSQDNLHISNENLTEKKISFNSEKNNSITKNQNNIDIESDKSETDSQAIKNQKPTPNIESKISTSRRKSTRLTQKVQNIQESSNVRRSSFDFIPKQNIKTVTKEKKNVTNVFDDTKIKPTPQRKSIKKTSIVCTRFHSTEVQIFQQIVKKLGVFFVEDEVTEKTTHLVAAEPRRTINLLRAMARGCWVLKSEWLYRSLEADHWLPEEDFELCEFSDAVQKVRQERQAFGSKFSMDIFSNCGSIYISKAANPRCSDLQELVILCKGTITTIVRNADIVVGEYIENKSCVTVNWIMDCITFYKRKSLKSFMIDPQSSD